MVRLKYGYQIYSPDIETRDRIKKLIHQVKDEKKIYPAYEIIIAGLEKLLENQDHDTKN